MKKQKKPVKIDSNMVCYTRGQRFRGYVAFAGLLACGFMLGWGFGGAPAKKGDVGQSLCEVQLQQFAQKQAIECAEKVEAQRQQCNDMLAAQEGTQDKAGHGVLTAQELDCIEKEELMLASLPNESEYDSLFEYQYARANAYQVWCSYCVGDKASEYCREKLDKEASKVRMLYEVKNYIENFNQIKGNEK